MLIWLNPVSGLSGDMFLGALADLGAPLDEVRAVVASTGLRGWRLDVAKVGSGALRATRAMVEIDDDVPERRARELLEIAGRAEPPEVASVAVRAIEAIARVEAALHGTEPDEVHLHEIGGLDTVVDTVGVAAALHLLGVTDVWSGPVALGGGTVTTRHGVLPLPAPATAALLAEAGAPVTGVAIEGETVTPTGAALLLATGAKFGPVPPMRLERVAYGVGSREVPGRPNVVQVLAGRPVGETASQVLLETNVDDVTPELLGYLVSRALEAGAADAWVTPIVMKKNRPAHTVHVLCAPERAADLSELVLAETGALGLRRSTVDRLALARRFAQVEVSGQPIRVKHGPYGRKPEHDDVVAAARALGRPVREIAAEALAADDLRVTASTRPRP